MIKTINVSYGISDEDEITVGEFEAEIYDEIENSLDNIVGMVSSMTKMKKLKKITITVKEISTEIEEGDEE